MSTQPPQTRPQERGLFMATMGCQMNRYDSQRLLGLLAGEGYRQVPRAEQADLILVNTCSVRERAEQKVYSFLGSFRGLKKKRPGLVLGVGGCVAQQLGARLLKMSPHLDFVFGPGALGQVPRLVAEAKKGKRQSLTPEDQGFGGLGIQLPARPGQKAMITVMQGCDNFCSYCVVPYVRGRERSRPAPEVIEEARALASAGVRELLLLGQNVNSYRDPGGGLGFAGLLREVAKVEGVWRIRFATSHPKDLSPELMQAMASLDKVMPEVHLPAQSGSNAILKAMNRGYTRGQYLEKVARLRQLMPDAALGGDMIVGFPGETEDDFQASLDLIREVGYDYLYSFKYSDRPLAKAARLEGKIAEAVMSDRLERLQQLQRALSKKAHQAMAGRTLEVLVEGPAKKGEGLMTGRSRAGQAVNFPGGPELAGSLAEVVIDQGRINSLMGHLARQP